MRVQEKNRNNVRKWRAFSLLEMVIVLGIIALILGAAITFSTGISDAARYTTTQATINETAAKLEAYRIMVGNYPTEEQGLRALVEPPATEPKPRRWAVQAKSIPGDAWGSPLVYRRPGRDGMSDFEIISAGPDLELGTEDDASSLDED